MNDRIASWRRGPHRATLLLIGLAIVSAAGCSGPQVMPLSGPHPATLPEQVLIYQDQPAKYEIIGTLVIPVSSGTSWDDRGNADSGFERLRTDAASRGANGVLLIAPPGMADRRVLAGYKGTFYQVPVQSEPKAAIAQAIWVIQQ